MPTPIMVPFFSIMLVISILGLMSLLAIKRLEVTTGRVVFASARPKVNGFFHSLLLFIELGIPFLVRVGTRRAMGALKAFIQKQLARGILWLEHTLQNILHVVDDMTRPAQSRGEASAFLREVGEYKKRLGKRMSRNHPTLEE